MGLLGGASFWMVLASALALLTIPGLVLFYRGTAAASGFARTMTLSFAGAAIVPILWLLYGHGMVFGAPLVSGFLGDPGRRMVIGDIPGADSLAVIAFVIASAVVAVTILAVAVANRMTLLGWLVFTAAWLSVVLFPVMYWVLNETGGWASEMGVADLAGGSFVQISAGTSALAVLLAFADHRRQSPDPSQLVDRLPASRRMWATSIGALLVLVAWLGLNISSEGTIDEMTGLIAVNTIVAAATGACGWIVAEKLSTSAVSRTAPSTGAVAGLVAIAPGCASFAPGWASAVGLLAGATCAFAVLASRRRRRGVSFKVVNIHIVAGVVGMLYIGIFAAEFGFIYNGNPAQSVAQVSTVVGVGVYSFAVSWVLGFAAGKVGFGIPRSEVVEPPTTSSMTELGAPKKISK